MLVCPWGTAVEDDGIGFRSGGEAALLVLLARAAGAGIVAADLGAIADLRDDRREVVVVVAVRAVDVAVMAMVVPMVMIVVAIGAMDVASSCGLAVRRAVGHASVPVRGLFFRGIAELPAVPKRLESPNSGWQSPVCDPRTIAFGSTIP